MHAPRFWFAPPPPAPMPIATRLLAPLGALYGAATARRLTRARPARAGVPVICVGNLVVGGAGKTPAAIALTDRLRAGGRDVHVVLRGHGGRAAGPLRVVPGRHGAGDVGDEALLHAAFGPTFIARDRAAGVAAAEAAGAAAVILDDGHQNPSVAKDLAIVVVDAARGFGNGRCLPAGPLREPVAAGLGRADMLLVVGPAPARAAFLAGLGPLPCAAIEGDLAPLRTGIAWQGRPVVAFAGIGDPARFFRTLRELGAKLVHSEALADHAPLGPGLLRRLARMARAAGADLVTTEKDAARLPPAWRGEVLTLPVRLEVADWAALDAAFARLGLAVRGSAQEPQQDRQNDADEH